jgi:hypothetical protein
MAQTFVPVKIFNTFRNTLFVAIPLHHSFVNNGKRFDLYLEWKLDQPHFKWEVSAWVFDLSNPQTLEDLSATYYSSIAHEDFVGILKSTLEHYTSYNQQCISCVFCKNILIAISASLESTLDTIAQQRYLLCNAKKIQKAWLDAYYNPERLVCHRRLLREFEALTTT